MPVCRETGGKYGDPEYGDRSDGLFAHRQAQYPEVRGLFQKGALKVGLKRHKAVIRPGMLP